MIRVGKSKRVYGAHSASCLDGKFLVRQEKIFKSTSLGTTYVPCDNLDNEKRTTTMQTITFQLSVDETDRFNAALKHYYTWVPVDQSRETFLQAAARALIGAHERGEDLRIPLRIVTS